MLGIWNFLFYASHFWTILFPKFFSRIFGFVGSTIRGSVKKSLMNISKSEQNIVEQEKMKWKGNGKITANIRKNGVIGLISVIITNEIVYENI